MFVLPDTFINWLNLLHLTIISGAIAVAFSMPIEIEFIANQPFLYVIANANDLAPLFSGRIAEF